MPQRGKKWHRYANRAPHLSLCPDLYSPGAFHELFARAWQALGHLAAVPPGFVQLLSRMMETPARQMSRILDGGVPCASIAISKTSVAFEVTRKRRKSFPSETRVKRGRRFVHGDVELAEKLGRNDLCPCGSGRRFQNLLPGVRPPRWRQSQRLLSGSEPRAGAPFRCRRYRALDGAPQISGFKKLKLAQCAS